MRWLRVILPEAAWGIKKFKEFEEFKEHPSGLA
jgi:hypothetical protein